MSARAKAICQTNKPDRWMAEITYNNNSAKVIKFEEIEDLDEIIEQGPDWNTIERIVITLNRSSTRPRRGVI